MAEVEITCSRCGKKEIRKAKAKWCLGCARHHYEYKPTATNKKKCAECGNDIHSTRTFCSPNCSLTNRNKQLNKSWCKPKPPPIKPIPPFKKEYDPIGTSL